jgi:hypothetical protein
MQGPHGSRLALKTRRDKSYALDLNITPNTEMRGIHYDNESYTVLLHMAFV